MAPLDGPNSKEDAEGRDREEKLAPWARARSHDTLSEMERRAKKSAASLLAAEAAARKRKEAAEAAERAKEEEAAANASPLTTASFEVEPGVSMGYHVMPTPAEREAAAKLRRRKKKQKEEEEERQGAEGKEKRRADDDGGGRNSGEVKTSLTPTSKQSSTRWRRAGCNARLGVSSAFWFWATFSSRWRAWRLF